MIDWGAAKWQVRLMLDKTTITNPITAKEIANRLDIVDLYDLSQPQLRMKIITPLLAEGYPVGSNGKGYFKMRNIDEANDYVNRLRRHIEGTALRITYLHKLKF